VVVTAGVDPLGGLGTSSHERPPRVDETMRYVHFAEIHLGPLP
jgi:hypothetical protein